LAVDQGLQATFRRKSLNLGTRAKTRKRNWSFGGKCDAQKIGEGTTEAEEPEQLFGQGANDVDEAIADHTGSNARYPIHLFFNDRMLVVDPDELQHSFHRLQHGNENIGLHPVDALQLEQHMVTHKLRNAKCRSKVQLRIRLATHRFLCRLCIKLTTSHARRSETWIDRCRGEVATQFLLKAPRELVTFSLQVRSGNFAQRSPEVGTILNPE
jgi:hypothetical protein